jgi:DNA polymerase III subunit gamma/tau
VIALVMAAQQDMRWTTSPRLTLELAFVRACLPETDPTPAGLTARLERLERLANLEPGTTVPAEPAYGTTAPPSPADAVDVPTVDVPTDDELVVVAEEPTPEGPAAPVEPEPAGSAAEPVAQPAGADDAEPSTQMPVPHAADAGSVDVALLRRSWPALMDHLGQMRQPVLRALLEGATPAAYDGTTLELAFPPDKRFSVGKVESRQDVLLQAIGDLFGIAPAIAFVVRESRERPHEPAVQVIEEDEAPADEAEALRRVQEMLGAQPIEATTEQAAE